MTEQEELVGMPQVCALTGFKPDTVRNYLARTNRKAREGDPRTPFDFPPKCGEERRDFIKSNGQRGVVMNSPLWRRADIDRYLEARAAREQELVQ
jgi:predicted DNA-binding transcriptional regulator AlpA